jgi:hypothetical protein
MGICLGGDIDSPSSILAFSGFDLESVTRFSLFITYQLAHTPNWFKENDLPK